MKYLIKMLCTVIPTLFGVVTAVFFMIHLAPGDPVLAMLGPYATPDGIRELRQELGMDRPLYVQYGKFIAGVMKGDLGRSLVSKESVMVETFRSFPYTCQLALSGVLVSVIMGIPIGIISAVHRNTPLDYLVRTVSISGISVPVFFLAMMFLLVFSFYLDWFPITGAGDPSSWRSTLHHLILPAATIGISMSVLIMRLTRSCMLEVLKEDYIRTARAKGIGENSVIWVHGLRNALLPIVTIVGIYIGHLLGGAILVETVFARPGVGKLLMDAILARDYPQVQGTALIFGCVVIFVNLAVDIVYRFLDPRIEL